MEWMDSFQRGLNDVRIIKSMLKIEKELSTAIKAQCVKISI